MALTQSFGFFAKSRDAMMMPRTTPAISFAFVLAISAVTTLSLLTNGASR